MMKQGWMEIPNSVIDHQRRQLHLACCSWSLGACRQQGSHRGGCVREGWCTCLRHPGPLPCFARAVPLIVLPVVRLRRMPIVFISALFAGRSLLERCHCAAPQGHQGICVGGGYHHHVGYICKQAYILCDGRRLFEYIWGLLEFEAC